MAGYDELKSKGDECFRKGHLELAFEFYSKTLDICPSSHIVLSNRSLVLHKLGRHESSLEDAERCIGVNSNWAKGYARKAIALNALARHKEAKQACIAGFALQEQAMGKVLVEEWLKASRSLVDTKYDALKKPPWSDLLPEAADLFCNEYCHLLHAVTNFRISDSQGMSHDDMVECVMQAVKIAEDVLAEFHHPITPSLREWAKAATIRFESQPKSDWGRLMNELNTEVTSLVRWLKDGLHQSLRQVMDPILILALSALLVRGNVLCQAYTGHYNTEYLGYASIGFFEQGVLSDPVFTAFHMAVLSCILNSYRLRGALIDDEVQLIRGICHKLENLLQHLPKGHKNYQILFDHYQHTVKLFREICAKVITGFTGSHDSEEALSELEIALLKCEEKPDEAMDMAVKYLSDIAAKSSSEPPNINLIDAENMLYITGILAKLNQHDQALTVFHNGESMVLSLMATMISNDVLSLDELPASITNCRKLALSGAIWLKDKFPKDAADVFIHWKSMFTELRAILIQLGLRDSYSEAYKAIEGYALKGDVKSRHHVQENFQNQERRFLQHHSLHIIRALYSQNYDSVAAVLQPTDVVIDYAFSIYNPEHHNPPQSQACAIVICPKKQPMMFSMPNKEVYELVQSWPKAVYKLWCSQDDMFKQITESLSNILFPSNLRKLLLDPMITRVFICPDVDLMCFPIDQLPLKDDDGSVLPLYERMSVSVLSSPRELLRDETVRSLRATMKSSGDSLVSESKGKPASGISLDSNKLSAAKEKGTLSVPPSVGTNEDTERFIRSTEKLHLVEPHLECFIVANPDYKLERSSEAGSSWAPWVGFLSGLLGFTEQPDNRRIPELKGSQKEAEAVYGILTKRQSLKVHPPIVQEKATMSAVINLRSPHVLHIATHGYSSTQQNVQYHGNFWADESCGILLAGAQTFLDKKFDRVDAKAGTGHMNGMAMCGMHLEGTCLVFITACDSSVGGRPAQEMTDSVTQALRAAGAQTVISTLWAVSDNDITEFVSHFYHQLLTVPHCHPSEALSYAKAVMKQKGQSMYYWGAYVCHGLDNPIDHVHDI